jgi:hypothetical protein
LRIGEYTGHKTKESRRTNQFRACDIIFYDANDDIIPNTAPLTATVAIMRITNQKNGMRGSRMSHTTSAAGTKARLLPREGPSSAAGSITLWTTPSAPKKI